MVKFKTQLISVDDVKKFVRSAMTIPTEVIVGEGKNKVDGKSIMGMFSLDLSNPITVQLTSEKYLDCFECEVDTDSDEEEGKEALVRKFNDVVTKYSDVMTEGDIANITNLFYQAMGDAENNV